MLAIQDESIVMTSILDPCYMSVVWRRGFVVDLWRCEGSGMGGRDLDRVVVFGGQGDKAGFRNAEGHVLGSLKCSLGCQSNSI